MNARTISLIALALSACGGSSTDPTAQASAAPSASTSVAAPSASSAQSAIATAFATLDNQPASLALIVGVWQLANGDTLTVDSSGNLTDSGTDCTLTGSAAVISPNFNLYTFILNAVSCPSGALDYTWSGVLTLDNSVSPNQLIGDGAIHSDSGDDFNQSFTATLQ
jgi:hypothetical protein